MDRAIARQYQPEASGEILYPEVTDSRIGDVEALARWLDYAFVLPGGFRYGLGGIIGLIPGLGDVLDAIFSLYIVARAVQLGIPRVTIMRMVVNVGIESIGGALPFVGALFDTVFKANRRNYQLLRTHMTDRHTQTRKDWIFVILAAAIALVGIAIPVILIVELTKHL